MSISTKITSTFLKFLLIQIFLISVLSFNCKNLDDLCPDQVSSPEFVSKTPEERKTALQKFYQDFIVANKLNKIDFEVKLNKNNEAILVPTTNVEKDQIMLSYPNESYVIKHMSLHIDMFKPESEFHGWQNGPVDYWVQKQRIQSGFQQKSPSLTPENCLISSLMLFFGRSEETVLENYFKALPLDTIWSPIFSFSEIQLNHIRDIDPTIFRFLQDKQNEYKSGYIQMNDEFKNSFSADTFKFFFNYEVSGDPINTKDYYWFRYIIETRGAYLSGNYQDQVKLPQILPGFGFTSGKPSRANWQMNDEIVIKASQDMLAFEEPEVTYDKSFAYYFSYYGKIVKDHPQECIDIQLWSHLGQEESEKKWTQHHYQLLRYIPFPNFKICYKNDETHQSLLKLLAKFANLDESQAFQCLQYALSVSSWQPGEIYAYLLQNCPNPELEKDFRALAIPDIKISIVQLKQKLKKLDKQIQKAQEKQNLEDIKSINLIKELLLHRIDAYEGAKKVLLSINWQDQKTDYENSESDEKDDFMQVTEEDLKKLEESAGAVEQPTNDQKQQQQQQHEEKIEL